MRGDTLYPAINITGTFGGAASTANGHNLWQIVSSRAMTYAAGPSFQWNILNYGQITNNVRLQDAKLQQLLVELSGERAQGAAGGGQRDFRLLELADTGRIPATQRRCGD